MKSHRQTNSNNFGKSKSENFIAYARTNDGQLVHVGDVERGIQCQSFCVECGSPLVAKKGQIKRWHFAHLDTSNCQGESVIHAVSKSLIVRLVEEGKLRATAPLQISKQYQDSFDSPYLVFHSEDTLAKPLVSAKVEVASKSQIVDVMAYDEDGGRLAFEIFKTHRKSAYDRELFKAQRLPALEIDVSRVPWDIPIDRLIKHLLNWKNQKWLFHPIQAEMQRLCDEKAVLEQKVSDLEKWMNARTAILDFIRKDNGHLQPRGIRSRASANNLLSRSYADVKVDFKILSFDESGIVIDDDKMVLTIPVSVLSDRGKTSRLLAFFYPKKMHIELEGASRQPCLTYKVGSSLDGHGFEVNPPSWENMSAWQSALDKIANEEVHAIVAEHDEKYLIHRSRTSKMKLKMLLHALKFDNSVDMAIGAYSKYWNANDAVWRAHVILQCMSQRTSFFSTESIPGVEIINAYLGFEPGLDIERSKSLYFWLKNVLVPNGCAQHAGKLVFSIDIDAIRSKPELLAKSSFEVAGSMKKENENASPRDGVNMPVSIASLTSKLWKIVKFNWLIRMGGSKNV